MRFNAVIFAIALGAFAIAGQAGIKLERKFLLGDKDSFKLTMQMSMPNNVELDIKGNVTQTVKKVYENGDADVENAAGEMTINMMGKEMKQAGGAPSLVRLNKFGAMVGDTKGKGMATFMVYATSLGDRELKAGETYPINYVDPKNPDDKVVGTVKAESIENGVATVVTKLDISQRGVAKPTHLDSKAIIDVATSKANRIEGSVSGFTMGPNQPALESMKFTFERVK